MEFKKRVLEFSSRMRVISLDDTNIYLQAKYGPSKVVKIPLEMNKNLAFFVGSIIGDGHLHKNKFRTSLELSNIIFLEFISKIVFDNFDIKSRIYPVKKRERKKQTYHLVVYSKAVEEMMNLVFDIPRGKKSRIVDVPELIMTSSDNIQKSFILGLLAAEGSKRGNNHIRISSSSKKLLENTQKMLSNLEMPSSIESWIYQKYKKEYYSLYFKRIHLDSLMRECQSGQMGQILSNLLN